MTGSHAEEPSGHRSGRPGLWRGATWAVALLCGSLLAVSAANSDGTDLRPGRYTDLAGLVEAESKDYQRVEERFTALSEEVDQLGAATGDEDVRDVRATVRQLRDPAGMTPRRGAGLRITLSDSPDELLEAALERKERNLRPFVVHQQDIQAVVNALWSGGATAVTIAGQRVISTTGIKCRGNAVQLQGVPYPQPYVIEAVGVPADLVSAIDADRLVSRYREDSDDPRVRVGWQLEARSQIDAPAFEGAVDLQYARPQR